MIHLAIEEFSHFRGFRISRVRSEHKENSPDLSKHFPGDRTYEFSFFNHAEQNIKSIL